MASRLLKALDARIAKTRDPFENTCLRAERAALLARQGRLDDARAELARIHSRFDSRPHARVSAWTSLAEGLVAFHESLTSSSRDKLMRAFALGTAVGDRNVRATGAAWLAHLDYLEQRFDAMVQNLKIALSEPSSGSALTRACLVSAQGYHWANRLDLAQPWYSRAHQLATRDGDETMLSALMHNMAWLRTAHARRLAMGRDANQDQIRQVLLGVESTDSFDKLIGTASLLSLVPTLRAHVLALMNQYSDALELFEQHWHSAVDEGFKENQCSLLAEIAWCHLNVGDASNAMTIAQEAERQIPACSQPDERAAAHGRLAQVYLGVGNGLLCNYHSEQEVIEWQIHSERQAYLLAILLNESQTQL